MDIVIPEVGESIVEAEIGQWFKKDGEQVKKDDLLLELETEKVNVELNADASGKLKILAEEGETVKVGAVVGRIDESAAEEAEDGEGGEEKEEGAEEREEGAAPEDSDDEEKAEKPPAEKDTKDTQKSSEEQEEGPPMNPAVAKLAAERGIDLSNVKGSGRGGRILVDDLPKEGDAKAAEKKSSAAKAPKEERDKAAEKESAGQKASRGKAEQDDRERRSERVPMTQIRKKIADHLLKARQETAMLTTFNEIDMSRVIALRQRHKESFEKKHGVPLGFMSFFLKACAESLKEFPVVNASIDGSDIVYHYFYDIGVAVGSKRGLVVPVVRDADQLHFDELEKTVRDYAERADSGKLSLDELSGGTFTISNGGIYGSLLSTPLLNPPQSAILGMHAIQERPVVVDGEIVIRPMMNVALSYDHRIIDGKESVSFLKQIKTYIETPEEMLLEM